MKKIDLGQTVTILANIGVIAGIVLLAVELRQNNVLLEAQSRANRLAIRKEGITLRLGNPELRRAIQKLEESGPLNDDERELLRLYYTNIFENFHYVYLETEQGLLDERELRIPALRAIYRAAPDSAQLWASVREIFHPNYVNWFEQNIIAD